MCLLYGVGIVSVWFVVSPWMARNRVEKCHHAAITPDWCRRSCIAHGDVVVSSSAMTPPKVAHAGSSVQQDPELLRRLLRAKDRMDAASHEEWPVRRLARVSGVSEAHFARSFKQAFGIPPHRYLLTRRVERAKALLRDTEFSITEIAFETGWASLGTFGRTFRDITGESPGIIRERERTTAGELGRVPHCYLSAAHRPDLTIAVSEKRRREGERKIPADDTTETEV